METIISQIFHIRDVAHRLHLSTRSFAAHCALGELYKALVDRADDLAEVVQGKYGLLNIQPNGAGLTVNDRDAISFIKEVAQWAEGAASMIPQDSFILNDWDEMLSLIYKTKYKLENLS